MHVYAGVLQRVGGWVGAGAAAKCHADRSRCSPSPSVEAGVQRAIYPCYTARHPQRPDCSTCTVQQDMATQPPIQQPSQPRPLCHSLGAGLGGVGDADSAEVRAALGAGPPALGGVDPHHVVVTALWVALLADCVALPALEARHL